MLLSLIPLSVVPNPARHLFILVFVEGNLQGVRVKSQRVSRPVRGPREPTQIRVCKGAGFIYIVDTKHTLQYKRISGPLSPRRFCNPIFLLKRTSMMRCAGVRTRAAATAALAVLGHGGHTAATNVPPTPPSCCSWTPPTPIPYLCFIPQTDSCKYNCLRDEDLSTSAEENVKCINTSYTTPTPAISHHSTFHRGLCQVHVCI